MRIEEQTYYDFDDVLIKPKRSSLSSRKEVNLEREFTFLHSGKTWSGIPIFASNMDTTGTWAMRDALMEYHMPTMIHKFNDEYSWSLDYVPLNAHYDIEFSTQLQKALTALYNYVKYTVPSFGIREEDTELLFSLIKRVNYFPNMIAFDVANGYMERYVDHIKYIRDFFKEKATIIAGNVATPEAVEALVFAGADIVKVGIGPSVVCDTRIKTGVGIPQLSAIINCADAAHGLGAHIIADGGCKTPADIAKAFGAGADFVMIGSMLAGHDESGGEYIEKDFYTDDTTDYIEKRKFKEVYGMSSEHAMITHYGAKDDYRASEGSYMLVPYKGAVRNTVDDILGGLRSTCSYVGAKRLKDLPKCTTFVKVNRVK